MIWARRPWSVAVGYKNEKTKQIIFHKMGPMARVQPCRANGLPYSNIV